MAPITDDKKEIACGTEFIIQVRYKCRPPKMKPKQKKGIHGYSGSFNS